MHFHKPLSRGRDPIPSRARKPAVLLTLLIAAPAFAHDISRSDSKIEIQGREVRATVTLNLKELQNPSIPLDSFQLDRDIGRVYDALRFHYFVTTPAQPSDTRLEQYSALGGALVRLRILYTFHQPVTEIHVRSTLPAIMPAGHQHLMS